MRIVNWCNTRDTMPCFGEPTHAKKNNSPAATAIAPAVLVPLKPNQIGIVIAPRCPSAAETTASPADISNITLYRSVSKYAVAGGTINMATTRMLPTVSNAATAVTAVIVINT